MEKVTGNRFLSGSFAEVFFNGIKIFGCTKITAKISVNREDVQIGLDIDTKITSLKGEGTISINRAYTAFEDVRQMILRGEDPRGTIITKLADPDAKGKGVERYQIDNVALNEFALEYELGALVKTEIPFSFTPSDMINLDKIER